MIGSFIEVIASTGLTLFLMYFCYIVHIYSDQNTLKFNNQEFLNFCFGQGEKGDRGRPGPKGNVGITYTSEKGQKGERGPQGPPGPVTISSEFTGNNETLQGKYFTGGYRIQLVIESSVSC